MANVEEEQFEGIEYSGMFLTFPAAVILTFWATIGWLAWIAVVAGLIGVILTPFAIVYVERHFKIEWWAFLGMGAVTTMFLGQAWKFVS